MSTRTFISTSWLRSAVSQTRFTRPVTASVHIGRVFSAVVHWWALTRVGDACTIPARYTDIASSFRRYIVALLVKFNGKVACSWAVVRFSNAKAAWTLVREVLWTLGDVASVGCKIVVCGFNIVWVCIVCAIGGKICRTCSFVRNTARPLTAYRS